MNVIPSFRSRLAPAEQKNRVPLGIECVKNPKWLSIMLDPQLAHVGMAGSLDLAAEGKAEAGASFLQQINHCGNILLLRHG
jgi:hypothetical protein